MKKGHLGDGRILLSMAVVTDGLHVAARREIKSPNGRDDKET